MAVDQNLMINAEALEQQIAAEPKSTSLPSDSKSSSSAGAPAYDTASYCRQIGDTAGGSYVIERTCRQQEMEALSAIRRMSIPARIQNYCAQIGETAGGSYVIYKTCAEQELEAASSL
jgi:hypothetical protein